MHTSGRIDQHGWREAAAICIAVILVVWLLVPWVTLFRLGSQWLTDFQVAYFSPPAEQHADIVLLTIGEDTLSKFPYRSPVNRRFLAELLTTLKQSGVRAVGIDILFDQPTEPENDQALRRELLDFAPPLVVAAGDRESGLTPRQIAFQTEYLAGIESGAATLLKHDGTVRFIAAGDLQDQRPIFAAALARQLGVSPPTETLPLLLRDTGSETPYLRTFPAGAVALLPGNWLEDKIVIIGADVPQQDRHRTPLAVMGGEHQTMAGVEIHARMLAQILDGTRLPRLPATLALALLAVYVLIAYAIAARPWRGRSKIALIVLALAALWVGSVLSFRSGGPLLPVFTPTMGFLLGLTVAWAYVSRRERSARAFLSDAFQHYLSPNVIEQLMADPRSLQLGGERREMSFLFSDLSGFSSLAEGLAPEKLVSVLQSYLDGIVEIALRHGATVDRFVGDAVLVFFNAPVESSRSRAWSCDHARPG